MPLDISHNYTFTPPQQSGGGGPQIVTATVTRGPIPVAPEPVYIKLDAQGFTLPAALHSSMDRKLSGLFYKTVWRTISGQFGSPQNLSINDKSTVHGPRFMWVFEQPGTYIADVTVVNMYDHTEVATTTITVTVEDYIGYFTAEVGNENRAFWIVTRDGNATTGIPAAVLTHSRTFTKTSLSQAATDMQNRDGKPVCILVKEGETHTERANFWEAETPNVYIRSYTGNLGSTPPLLTAGTGISFGSNFPTAQRSIQIMGLEYDGGLDPLDPNESSTTARKFIDYGIGGNHFLALVGCRSRNASIPVQTTAGSADTYGVVWDCDLSESIQCNFLEGFGRFTAFVGSRLMYAQAAPGTYPGLSSGWSIRHKDKSHHWMCEIGAKAGHDSSDAVQPGLRIGKTTGQGGDYTYVGASTVFSNISFGTAGTFDNTTSVNGVVEGCRIATQSQRLNGVISPIMTGIVAWNNITTYPSANPHLSSSFDGATPMSWDTISGLAPDNDVLNAGLDAQFNTHVSLSDVSNCGADNYVGTDGGNPHAIANITEQNNIIHAPYEATPVTGEPVDLSRYGALSHIVPPYEAHDVAVQHGTGVAEDMVTLTGTGLGFVAGETLAQGGVSAVIYVVQDDGVETRIWLANTTGGSFAAGLATSASGSGTLNGPAEYRGTMVDGTPASPIVATAKTWVPTIDHYGAARTYAGATKGAAQI